MPQDMFECLFPYKILNYTVFRILVYYTGMKLIWWYTGTRIYRLTEEYLRMVPTRWRLVKSDHYINRRTSPNYSRW